MKQARPMGQRMYQARARSRRAVEAGEKAQDAMLKAQADFEQAQQEVVQALSASWCGKPPLLAMPAPQVTVNLVKSLEALTGLIQNMWNSEAGPPPDQLIHAIQESRAILQTSLSKEVGAALEAEVDAEQHPELRDQDEDEAEEMERAPKRHMLYEGRRWR